MVSFIRRLFGGGGSSTPTPAPRQAVVPSGPSAAELAAKAATTQRRGIARNKTVYTDTLGLSTAQKSDVSRKYLTGV